MIRRIIVLFALSSLAWGQVTVVQSPVPKFRSFLPSGSPNVGGCVYTFASGTSTPLATYVDFTGLITNSNPVILDANGEAPIWITGSTYRFQVWSFGSGVIGSNCGNGTQLYQIDGIRDTGLSAFTSGPVLIAPTSNGIDILGIIRATDISPTGNFLNFKSFAGASLFKVDIFGNVTGLTYNKVTITAPTTSATLVFGVDNTTQTFQGSDTIVGRATTDTLSNKTLASPVISGALSVANMLLSSTSPSIAGNGCGGTGANINFLNGTASFIINVGATPTTSCTVTLPTAAHHWTCNAQDQSTQSTTVFLQRQTNDSATSAVLTNFNTAGAAANMVASDLLYVSCFAN